jgi:aminocarboxymuconate-semialdehyde decarboxylase
MLKIDMHAHILPREWPDMGKLRGASGIPSIDHGGARSEIRIDGKFFRAVDANSWDMPRRIEEYATHGVQVQVICTVPVMFSYHAAPAHALELSRFLNDHVAALQAEHPRNVIALGTVPMQDTASAIAELRRLREELDLPGIQIGSNVNDRNLDDPELLPIFEAAADLGLAILVHPWQMLGSASMPDYWLPWLVGMPAELSRAICSLIFGGVMERLPALRWCFAHGGGSFPWTIGRIEHGFNMRPDLVATRNAVNPRDYLGRFWVDSVTHDPQALRYLLEVVGADKVVLGTDYPFPLGEQQPGKAIDALQLPDAQRSAIFHANALQWLDLPLERFA